MRVGVGKILEKCIINFSYILPTIGWEKYRRNILYIYPIFSPPHPNPIYEGGGGENIGEMYNTFLLYFPHPHPHPIYEGGGGENIREMYSIYEGGGGENIGEMYNTFFLYLPHQLGEI
jgi:hypothetical protein